MNYSEIEYKSIEQQQQFQKEKFLELLHYINGLSPFYKKLFQEKNIDLKNIQELQHISTLPFTTKDDLQNFNNEFICVEKKDIAEYTATTGTLGNAVTIALSHQDIERLAYNEALSFLLMQLNSNDTVQLLLTLDRQFMAGMAYYLGLKKLGISSIRSGPGLPSVQIDIAIKNNATVWVAVPSFILKIIDYAEQHSINLNELPVKKILCIGENIRNEKLEYNSLAKQITNKWNVQLFSTYASTEMQTAFSECTEGNGAHYHPELIIPEIIDDHGNVLPHGEYGELVITTLGIKAMPFLRYKTGDIACLHTAICSCGRTSYRISPIIGRKKQMIKYKGTTIYPPALYELLQQSKIVNDYVVEVSNDEHNNAQIKLYIHTTINENECKQALSEFLKAKLRFVPELVFTSAHEIEQLLFKTGTRKAQKFIDLRK